MLTEEFHKVVLITLIGKELLCITLISQFYIRHIWEWPLRSCRRNACRTSCDSQKRTSTHCWEYKITNVFSRWTMLLPIASLYCWIVPSSKCSVYGCEYLLQLDQYRPVDDVTGDMHRQWLWNVHVHLRDRDGALIQWEESNSLSVLLSLEFVCNCDSRPLNIHVIDIY